MSVIYPPGNNSRFSVATVDRFATMTDAMNYLRYQLSSEMPEDFADVVSKSNMGEIAPDGFEYSIIYELVHAVDKEE